MVGGRHAILRTRAVQTTLSVSPSPSSGLGGSRRLDGNKKRYDQRSRLRYLVTPAMRGTFDVAAAADTDEARPAAITRRRRRVTYRSAVTHSARDRPFSYHSETDRPPLPPPPPPTPSTCQRNVNNIYMHEPNNNC